MHRLDHVILQREKPILGRPSYVSHKGSESRFSFFVLINQVASHGEIVQVLNVDAEEKDIVEDISENYQVWVVTGEVIINGGEEYVMESTYFIYIGKQLLALIESQYSS